MLRCFISYVETIGLLWMNSHESWVFPTPTRERKLTKYLFYSKLWNIFSIEIKKKKPTKTPQKLTLKIHLIKRNWFLIWNIWKRILLISPILSFYHIAKALLQNMHLFGSKKLVVVTAWFTYQTPCAIAVIHHKNSILRSKLTVGLNDHSSVESVLILFLPTINLVLQALKNP